MFNILAVEAFYAIILHYVLTNILETKIKFESYS